MRQTLFQMAIRIAIVVAVATVISYFHVSNSLQIQALEQLRNYIEQRGMRESNLFLWARDNLLTFKEEYVQRLAQLGDLDPQNRFEELFIKYPDGSLRLQENLFEQHDVTGIVGKYAVIDAALRRQLVTAFDMLAQYGPAWQNRFVNLYITTPENAVLMFWPDEPWGLRANSWEIYAKLALHNSTDEPVLILDADHGEREAVWSDLYFDYAVNDWMVSGAEPINIDGRYFASVGHDMLLSQLIDRTINNRLDGTYNILFHEDGRVLAHPRYMDAIQASSGSLPVSKAGDEQLLRIFNLVKQWPTEATIVDNERDEEYLAVAQLQGPGWFLVTVFPKAIIAKQAFKTARLILVLGAIALLLEIVMSLVVLREQIARPLSSLMVAANRVSAGDFNTRLDEQRPDEIGRLGHSFNAMSREIEARETALNERNIELSRLNQQLAEELEERNRAEQEIIRQREALNQSEKLNALGSLLAGVAHELNNPLSVVVGRAIMLEESSAETKTKDRAKKIRQAAERCSRIVKTFLAIARQQPPERTRVQLNEVINGAIELMAYSLRTADIQVVQVLDADLPELSADGDQLTQVFTNLVVNAQQALAEVTPPRRLSISSFRQPTTGTVRVEVTDNGPGVPVEMQSRIFEPFYTTKPVGVGTGIGLSFSYSVIESHGGKLTLENPTEGGACFVITLPVLEDAAPISGDPLEVGVEARPQMVLVVDDEIDIAELLGEILSRDGHRIDFATSGNAALREIYERDYDLILSDLKMPDLDGPGLFEQLQQSHPHLLERVIFVTGDTLGIAAREFLHRTGRPLIEKPFIPDEVMQIARQVLTQVKQTDAPTER
ncbi:MAG: ATP-binding protein [Candidatus Competibacteraceae bacterium]|jgi:signal transduction histidine kinase/ActR/RegA family two-component response regulator|nr:ATP-binding protein [Candidatus Competibacteraceae bacterium]